MHASAVAKTSPTPTAQAASGAPSPLPGPAARAVTNARRYCARVFSEAELALIRTLIAEHDPPLNRAALSRMVCERLEWRKPDGGLKDMSARVALLKARTFGGGK